MMWGADLWHSRRCRHVAWRWNLLAWACAGGVFSLWPELDLRVTALFYAGHGQFPWQSHLGVQGVYQGVPWLGRLALLVSAGMVWQAWHRPGCRPVWQTRRALALLLVLLLGVGGLVHAVFKAQWGRARPHQVQAFGGSKTFQPALWPSDQCARNCSFVSGHASTGFVLMALGMLGAPQRRRFWGGTAWGVGCLIGGVRIVQGGHFLSDVVFAGLMIWSTCQCIRWVWLVRCAVRRRRRTLPPVAAAMQVSRA